MCSSSKFSTVLERRVYRYVYSLRIFEESCDFVVIRILKSGNETSYYRVKQIDYFYFYHLENEFRQRVNYFRICMPFRIE